MGTCQWNHTFQKRNLGLPEELLLCYGWKVGQPGACLHDQISIRITLKALFLFVIYL